MNRVVIDPKTSDFILDESNVYSVLEKNPFERKQLRKQVEKRQSEGINGLTG